LPPFVVESILQSALSENRSVLLEPEAKEVCRAYQMPIPDFGVAHSESEAAALAEKVAFPVVLKIVSRDVLHKSEARGVYGSGASVVDARIILHDSDPVQL